MNYQVGASDVCPHCGSDVQFIPATVLGIFGPDTKRLDHVLYEASRDIPSATGKIIGRDQAQINASQCPRYECGKLVLSIRTWKVNPETKTTEEQSPRLVYPQRSQRKPIHADVPAKIKEDFEEAALVLPLSTKASAALSRRCLQNLLTVHGFTKGDLSEQIAAAIPTLPSAIAGDLDAIRAVGNFAAHPIKSKSTGEIVDVEVGEAEWSLEVLEELFDLYYARKARSALRRNELNQKLKAAGKPEIKGT